MDRYEKAVASVKKHEAIIEGVIKGMEKAEKLAYSKPYDKAVAILVCLEEAGFKVTRTPRRDGLTPGLK